MTPINNNQMSEVREKIEEKLDKYGVDKVYTSEIKEHDKSGATYPELSSVVKIKIETSRELLIEELETLINSHYIAKEKVKRLKMEHHNLKRYIEETMFHPSDLTREQRDNFVKMSIGYDKAVSEINKSIDLMMEDNNV